jgi:uncharacterized protein YbaA (DUF1428 family)
MWFKVKERLGDWYLGALDNDPYFTDIIRAGMPLWFQPRHVIDIYRADHCRCALTINSSRSRFAARLDSGVIWPKHEILTAIGADMAHYIDGFVFPIPRDRLNEYKRLAQAAARIWKGHGALDYWEYIGDDLKLEGTRSFTDLIAATDDETIVFGWVAFDSREARDLANEKVAADPRMAELIASSNSGFDAKRMAYGGFQLFVQSSNANA